MKKKWTRRELTLRPGMNELAQAVIEQWVKDGKPVSDIEGIKCWKEVLNASEAKESSRTSHEVQQAD